MIALTQEKRKELVSRLKIYIRTTETAFKAGFATEEDLFNLEVRKIALESLTANRVIATFKDYAGCKYPVVTKMDLNLWWLAIKRMPKMLLRKFPSFT